MAGGQQGDGAADALRRGPGAAVAALLAAPSRRSPARTCNQSLGAAGLALIQALEADGGLPMSPATAVLAGPGDETPVAELVGVGVSVAVLVGVELPVGVPVGDGEEVAVGVESGVEVGLPEGVLLAAPLGEQLADPEGRADPLELSVAPDGRELPPPAVFGTPPMAPGPGPLFADGAMTCGRAVSAR